MVRPSDDPAARAQPPRDRERAGTAPILSLAAAVLAVVAAVASLLSAQTTSGALGAKNDALLAQTRASDAYNEYESRDIRAHVASDELISHPRLSKVERDKLLAIATYEDRSKEPLRVKGLAFDRAVGDALARAERERRAHDFFEKSATILEITIAVVSISALTSSRALTAFGGVCALAGIGLLAYGLAVR